MSSRIISLNYAPCIPILPKMFHLLSSCLFSLPCMDCPTLSPKSSVWEKPCRWGKNPAQQQKRNAHFSHQKNPPHQIAIFMKSPNTSFIYSCSHCCCIIFLTSGFMYRYIMLILISWGLSAAWQKHWMVKIPPSKIPNLLLTFQWYLENPALIIACFPSLLLPFFISNFISFFLPTPVVTA